MEHDAKQTVTNNLTVDVSKGRYATTVDSGQMVIEVTNSDHKLSAKQNHALADDKIDLAVASCKIVIDPTGIMLSAFGSSIKLDASGVTVIGPLIKLNN